MCAAQGGVCAKTLDWLVLFGDACFSSASAPCTALSRICPINEASPLHQRCVPTVGKMNHANRISNSTRCFCVEAADSVSKMCAIKIWTDDRAHFIFPGQRCSSVFLQVHLLYEHTFELRFPAAAPTRSFHRAVSCCQHLLRHGRSTQDIRSRVDPVQRSLVLPVCNRE